MPDTGGYLTGGGDHTVISAALPEFLGSLAAGLLLAAGGWVVGRAKARRARPPRP